MRSIKQTLLVIVAISLVGIVWILLHTDDRLPGSFLPDVDATYAEWKPWPEVTQGDMGNIVSQIFGTNPLRFTKRTMAMQTGETVITNRYWVIWKGADSVRLLHWPFSLLSVVYTEDGIWISTLPRDDTTPHIWLRRQ